jgi:hypothetical protein
VCVFKNRLTQDCKRKNSINILTRYFSVPTINISTGYVRVIQYYSVINIKGSDILIVVLIVATGVNHINLT